MADLPIPDYRVQVSFKFGTVRDNMINVRGDTWEDVAELLDAIPADIADKIGSAEAAIGVVQMIAEATGGKVETVSVTENAQASGPVVPSCAHGVRKWFSKGDWQAFFCPLPKGAAGQCDPIFKNKDNEGQYAWR